MKKLIFKKREMASIAILGAALTLLPSQAFATDSSIAGFTSFADTILGFMTGAFATVVGAIAIAFVGYRWFSGRMEMGRAAATIGGIVLIIGSAQIVGFIRSGTGIVDGGAAAPADAGVNFIINSESTKFAELNDVTLARRLV